MRHEPVLEMKGRNTLLVSFLVHYGTGLQTQVADDTLGLRVPVLTSGRRGSRFETGRRRQQPGDPVHSYLPSTPRPSAPPQL